MIRQACDGCGLVRRVSWYDDEDLPEGVPSGGYCVECIESISEGRP